MSNYHRITVNLTKDEGKKLVAIASKNERKPAGEARVAIRKHIKGAK